MSWQVFAASAVGSSHIASGLPCQDAFAHQVVDDVLCAAVCDGAGSAAAADQGARHLAQGVVAALVRRLAQRPELPSLTASDLRDELETIIHALRGELKACADQAGRALSEYASTLVGVVARPDQGWLFHIGDGLAVACPRAEGAPEQVSRPENGEYANETYFVTGETWQAHLRLTPICEPVSTVVLMSDGAAPFSMQPNLAGLFRPFMDPVAQYLRSATTAEGDEALAGLLADPRTEAITSDDKTLLIALWRT